MQKQIRNCLALMNGKQIYESVCLPKSDLLASSIIIFSVPIDTTEFIVFMIIPPSWQIGGGTSTSFSIPLLKLFTICFTYSSLLTSRRACIVHILFQMNVSLFFYLSPMPLVSLRIANLYPKYRIHFSIYQIIMIIIIFIIAFEN